MTAIPERLGQEIVGPDLRNSGLGRMDEPAKDLMPSHSSSSSPPISTDNIDLSQARVNPDAIPKPNADVDNRPIWQRENAECFASSPGTESYVIWPYMPGDEGVIKYPKFDNYDPLPYHFYKSQEEYDKARKAYRYGGVPEKIINVQSMPSWNGSLSKPAKPNLTFVESAPASVPQELKEAA